MNVKGYGRKRSLPNLRYYSGILLEGLRRTRKLSQANWFPGDIQQDTLLSYLIFISLPRNAPVIIINEAVATDSSFITFLPDVQETPLSNERNSFNCSISITHGVEIMSQKHRLH